MPSRNEGCDDGILWYLRRDPDEAGYQFWLGKLNQFSSKLRAGRNGQGVPQLG